MRRFFHIKSTTLFAVAITLAGLCLGTRAVFDGRHGLVGEYFAGELAGGVPAATTVDAEISTATLTAAWPGAPPAVFTARWFGFVTIWKSGTYTFSTSSDDGSSVTIDGARVVENGGVHGLSTITGRTQLAAGIHAVLIEYEQRGGPYEFGWAWARDQGEASPVPAWALTPARVSPVAVIAARALQLAAMAGFTVALLLAPFALPRMRLVQRFPRTAVLALFAGMAVVHTWPLASDPAHLSRSDNADTLLNEWIIAWVAHQAPHDPARLFEANIFHPEHDTLAYSEAMIVQSAVAAPVLWLGGSPVLAYSIALLTGFTLTGWTMALVIAKWTESWTAAMVSGLVFAFNAHSLTRIPHLQAQHVEFLPLALYALDQLLTNPTFGRALRLALWFTLQALTSVYLMVFTAAAMVAAALVRPDAVVPGRRTRVALTLAAAGGIAALALVPFLLPYWRVNQEQGLTRSLADAAWYSATWRDYLSTPARLHYLWWSYRFFIGTALFPGATGLLLAAVALASGQGLSDRRARMCLAIGVAGVALSFGPSLPGYPLLYQLLPVLRAIRATARFGFLATFAVAALAGFGVAVLQRRIPPRVWSGVAVILVAAAAFEATAAPLGLTRVENVPAIYTHLPADAGAVVELPFFDGRNPFRHAAYMLNSTAHWRPILNGYSGFQPGSFSRNAELLTGFPDDRSVQALKELGVTHVFVHGDLFAPQRLDRFPEISLVETSGSITLYRLRR